jgi:hypothetical protein
VLSRVCTGFAHDGTATLRNVVKSLLSVNTCLLGEWNWPAKIPLSGNLGDRANERSGRLGTELNVVETDLSKLLIAVGNSIFLRYIELGQISNALAWFRLLFCR